MPMTPMGRSREVLSVQYGQWGLVTAAGSGLA